MLLKLTNLIVPHPFLAISKCISKCTSKIKEVNKIISNKNYEAIYMLLPKDDLDNLKCYELNRWVNLTDPGVLFEKQEEEIEQFNKIIHEGGSEYNCSISLKTNTKIYSEKVQKVKDLFNELQSKVTSNNINYKIIDKLIIFYDNNIKNFKDLIKKKNEYNIKYNFESVDFNDKTNLILLEKENMFDYSNNITEFIKDYLNNSNCNKYINYVGSSYYKKYIKYKMKYMQLKNTK